MTLAELHHRRIRPWLAALLPLLCLRALLPMGIMPVVGGDGWMTVQLCTANGFVERRFPIRESGDTGRRSPGDDGAPKEPVTCPVAFSGWPGPSPSGLATPVRVAAAWRASAESHEPLFPAPLPRSQTARGPPSLPG